MKYLFKEEAAEYNSYKFPYLVYAQADDTDNPDELMEQGLLPTRIAPKLYYKARSVRIGLDQFAHSSENRRIAKKTSYLTIQETPIVDAVAFSESLITLAHDYYEKKFGKQIIPAEALRKIMSGNIFTHLLTYTDNETHKPMGYTIVFRTEKTAYYAYPMYDMSYLSRNAGIGMMQQACDYYKEKGFSWLYVGTAYTNAAKYKLQLEPIQWHSGNSWQTDIDALKAKLN